MDRLINIRLRRAASFTDDACASGVSGNGTFQRPPLR